MTGLMRHPWFLLAVWWVAPARPQYINTGSVPSPQDLSEHAQHSFPYTHFFNLPPNLEKFDSPLSGEYQPRQRRTPDDKAWPQAFDSSKSEEVPTPIEIDYHDEENKTEVEKRNFSPWGGKRDGPHAVFEHMWSWKRTPGVREPSMPKRVRFSPWGGKRSGQMILKPGTNKASKFIFFSSVPELRRIVSDSPSGRQLNLASYHFVPSADKRTKVLAMSSSGDPEDRAIREALPFNNIMESPQLFKPGHPYNEVHLKKDGKRKTKFSIWGGKRSPPIIGPIWTPASEDLQDATLRTILLLRNQLINDETPTAV